MKPSYRLTTLLLHSGHLRASDHCRSDRRSVRAMMGAVRLQFHPPGHPGGREFRRQVTADILLSGTIDKRGSASLCCRLPAGVFPGWCFRGGAAAVSGHIFIGAAVGHSGVRLFERDAGVLLSPVTTPIPGGDKGAGHEPDAFLLRLGDR